MCLFRPLCLLPYRLCSCRRSC